jgi:hypothetical protein
MEIVIAVSMDGDQPWLRRVLVLSVIASRAHRISTIALNQRDHLSHLH